MITSVMMRVDFGAICNVGRISEFNTRLRLNEAPASGTFVSCSGRVDRCKQFLRACSGNCDRFVRPGIRRRARDRGGCPGRSSSVALRVRRVQSHPALVCTPAGSLDDGLAEAGSSQLNLPGPPGICEIHYVVRSSVCDGADGSREYVSGCKRHLGKWGAARLLFCPAVRYSWVGRQATSERQHR